MNKIKYLTAVVGFFQIKNSFNGASEVSQSIFESIKSNKKLFELKNPDFTNNNYKFNTYINSYFIKPIKIINQIIKVINYLRKSNKKFLIIEGASWIGYSYFFIKIIKLFLPEVIIMYHAHNIEYEIRKMKNSFFITYVTKILEKKVYKISDYATVVSKNDQISIKKLYGAKATIFFNGICKKKLKVENKKIKESNYIIFSGNYFFLPNKNAIDKLIQLMPNIHKINKKIKLIITGTDLPKKILKNKNIIFKQKLKKEMLNLYLKKSICSIFPIEKSPGTKLKVIENLLIGALTIGSKYAFQGIELIRKNPPFIYKSEKELINLLKNIINNKIKYNSIAKKDIKIYKKKYLMENILNKFLKENEFKFS